jgi:mannonate dehydratase
MPLLDWTRTDLAAPVDAWRDLPAFLGTENGGLEIFMLGATRRRNDYPADVITQAASWFQSAHPMTTAPV